MYQSLYIPCDNSAHALARLDSAIAIARACGAQIAASHVLATALHDRHFRQMESGLPEPYRIEDKLVESRDIYDDLITRGLSIISGSYLDVATEALLHGRARLRTGVARRPELAAAGRRHYSV